MTRRLPTLTTACGTVAAASATPAAIVNKLLADRGRPTYSTPAQIADILFDGSARVGLALRVVVSLVLLGALAATLIGIYQTLRGDRGGLELTLSGVYGLLGLIAALTVVM